MKKLLQLAALLLLLAPASAGAAAPGDLIKLADDGNSGTQHDTAVYYVADDAKRYVFPNAQAYGTWYADFSTVKTVSATEMASHAIGGNVTYRPGTRLVKIVSDPKTYAVEPGGVLRGIASEAVAAAIYGPAWNARIDDVPDAFFVNYVVGSPLETATYPNGSVVRATDGALFYIDGGLKRRIADDVRPSLRLHDANILDAADLSAYPDGPGVAEGEAAITDASGRSADDAPEVPTFSIVQPATANIGVDTDASLLRLRYAAREATVITRLTVRLDALTNKDTTLPDTDEGGLVFGNGAQTNFTSIRFVDGAGAAPFGTKELALDTANDQSQTLVFTGAWHVPAGLAVELTLKAGTNALLPTGERYRATLLMGGVTITEGGVAAAFLPTADLAGPSLTTLVDTFRVEIGAGSAKTLVRGTPDVEMVAFILRARATSANTLTALTVQGYIDEGESGSGGLLPGSDSDNGTPTTVAQMMPTVSLYGDDGALLAGPVAVDVNGRAMFSGFAYAVPAGGSRSIAVKGDLSATVDLEFNPNVVSFDVVDAASDAIVVDEDGASVRAVGALPNGGTAPKRRVTVRKAGTIDIGFKGTGGTVIAGREEILGTVEIETEYDAYRLENITFEQPSGNAVSLGDVRLEYPTAAGTVSATASFIGGTVTFTGIDARITANATTALKLYGKIRSKDAGAAYQETIVVRMAPTGPFTFVSLSDGDTYDASRFTGGDFVLSQNAAGSRLVRWSNVSAKKLASSPTTVYRSGESEVLRFGVTAEPEGPIRLKKFVFKLTPNDVGVAGAPNDALENWADENGDFADDDGIVTLRRIVAGGPTQDPIGEDPSTSIKFGIVSGGQTVASPSAHVSVVGDHGRIEYIFNDGAEYYVAAGTTAEFSLELMTSALNADRDRTLGVDLLTGADFLFTDVPSGAYTPLNGAASKGVNFTHSVSVPN